MHAIQYKLSHGESRGNDSMHKSRQLITPNPKVYNNSPPYVMVNMAATP